MKKHKSLIAIAAIIMSGAYMLLWSSCNKKAEYTAPIVPGNEPITTLQLIAQNINVPSDVDTGTWTQLNTNGGAIDYSRAQLHLRKNSSYRVYINFLDLDFPVSNDTPYYVTGEIEARKNFHLVCFQADTSFSGGFSVGTPALGTSDGTTLGIYREDSDGNTPPLAVGLIDSFVTGGACSGILDITLHHQPNVKNGQCPPGSIDIEATDTIYIQ